MEQKRRLQQMLSIALTGDVGSAGRRAEWLGSRSRGERRGAGSCEQRGTGMECIQGSQQRAGVDRLKVWGGLRCCGTGSWGCWRSPEKRKAKPVLEGRPAGSYGERWECLPSVPGGCRWKEEQEAGSRAALSLAQPHSCQQY